MNSTSCASANQEISDAQGERSNQRICSAAEIFNIFGPKGSLRSSSGKQLDEMASELCGRLGPEEALALAIGAFEANPQSSSSLATRVLGAAPQSASALEGRSKHFEKASTAFSTAGTHASSLGKEAQADEMELMAKAATSMWSLDPLKTLWTLCLFDEPIAKPGEPLRREAESKAKRALPILSAAMAANPKLAAAAASRFDIEKARAAAALIHDPSSSLAFEIALDKGAQTDGRIFERLASSLLSGLAMLEGSVNLHRISRIAKALSYGYHSRQAFTGFEASAAHVEFGQNCRRLAAAANHRAACALERADAAGCPSGTKIFFETLLGNGWLAPYPAWGFRFEKAFECSEDGSLAAKFFLMANQASIRLGSQGLSPTHPALSLAWRRLAQSGKQDPQTLALWARLKEASDAPEYSTPYFAALSPEMKAAAEKFSLDAASRKAIGSREPPRKRL